MITILGPITQQLVMMGVVDKRKLYVLYYYCAWDCIKFWPHFIYVYPGFKHHALPHGLHPNATQHGFKI